MMPLSHGSEVQYNIRGDHPLGTVVLLSLTLCNNPPHDAVTHIVHTNSTITKYNSNNTTQCTAKNVSPKLVCYY